MTKENDKKTLAIYVAALLIVNFLLGYLGHNYFKEGLLDYTRLGFWLGMGDFAIIAAIVLRYKKIAGWDWADLGLGKPESWWQPVLIAAGTYGAVKLFSRYIIPHIMQLGERPDISHLMDIPGNLGMLIFSLIVVWITAAFLEEFIFRAFLINALDKLFGKGLPSTASAVVISSLLFGLGHSYQGVTGILITGGLGLIFGVAFILNGRRIWPLILVHGLIDTISFIGIYNM